MRSRLFAEPTLNYKKAVELALALEAAERHAEAAGASSHGGVPAPDGSGLGQGAAGLHRVGAGPARLRRPACWRCGKERHAANKCRYKAFVCNKCNQKGHLAQMCTKNVSSGSANRLNNTQTNVGKPYRITTTFMIYSVTDKGDLAPDRNLDKMAPTLECPAPSTIMSHPS
ncbi:unnamed protein product, partial [Iphiclides podalirius]